MAVSSIGAGGGSIVYFDHAGLLRVGPESAGSTPGPACYGRGGTRPTLTDAYLLVGYLNPANFLGGRMQLDSDLAAQAFAPLAEQLGTSLVYAASSACEIAAAGMYAELASTLSREGIDPGDLTLVAYGGAGPVQAGMLAEDFHIERILVPLMPGTMGAMGAISSDVRRDHVMTVNSRVSPEAVHDLADAVRRLEEESGNDEIAPGGASAKVRFTVEAKYAKQAFPIEVRVEREWLSSAEGLHMLVETFHAEHTRVYGHADRSQPIDIMAVHAAAVRVTPKPGHIELQTEESTATPAGQRPLFYRRVEHIAEIYDRSQLRRGSRVAGPAVVEQPDATTVVPPNWVGEVDAVGSLILTRNP